MLVCVLCLLFHNVFTRLLAATINKKGCGGVFEFYNDSHNSMLLAGPCYLLLAAARFAVKEFCIVHVT